MTQTSVHEHPDPEASGETTPEPDGGSGDQLGNILIGSAIVMLLILGLGIRYALSSGGEEEPFVPDRRDAEVEFAPDRDRDIDQEREFARDTFLFEDDDYDDRASIECDELDDGDAETRFADDAQDCVTRGQGGLFGDVDEPINFRRLERPTLRSDLSDRGSSRLYEISIWLGDGRDDIDMAIQSDYPIARNGNGAAIRTNTDAVLLSDSSFVTIRRPDDCRDGCNVTAWITLGPGFQQLYPDAELMLFAGDGADASIEEIDRLPREAYR